MDEETPKKSPLAIEIQQFKQSLLDAEKKRHPLPQPLFWSLFTHRLNSLKSKKKLQETITDILDG